MNRHRYLAALVGGALVGVAGAAFSLDQKLGWSDGHTAGFGWIALAIVIFGGWQPVRVAVGCYLFGALQVVALRLQDDLPGLAQILPSLPFPLMIFALVVVNSAGLRRLARADRPEYPGGSYPNHRPRSGVTSYPNERPPADPRLESPRGGGTCWSRSAFEFDVVAPDVDEHRHPNEEPFDYVVRIARAKAESAVAPDAVVVAADTIVVIDGQVLGKAGSSRGSQDDAAPARWSHPRGADRGGSCPDDRHRPGA